MFWFTSLSKTFWVVSFHLEYEAFNTTAYLGTFCISWGSIKSRMSAFPLPMSRGGKLQTHVPPIHENLFYPGQDPACGGLEALSECDPEHFCLMSKFHRPPMPWMKEYLCWKAKWTDMETGSGPGSEQGLEAATERGEPCQFWGEFPEDPHSLWVHCPLQLGKRFLHLVSQLIALKPLR